MKRTFIKATCIIALCLAAPLLQGCPQPNQDAVVISGVGVLAESILTIDGRASDAAQALKFSRQLAVFFQNFKPGDSTENILQVGNAFLAIVRADTNSKAAQELATIAQTILNVIDDYNTPAPMQDAVLGLARANVEQPRGPRTAAQFKAAINAELDAQPVAGLVKLK
jgi:hypothetical protein